MQEKEAQEKKFDGILQVESVYQKKLWGSEDWKISAHNSGDCTINNGLFKGQLLSEIWEKHPEFFGNINSDIFPLLIKIIDAQDDLSVQVHPDNNYAKMHEHGALGKHECWYILDCNKNATIIAGQKCKSRQELIRHIENKDWANILNTFPIKKGDFLYIAPGTVHAIKDGTKLIEIQQSSDVTYRLYDYDRLENGKLRELHIEKALDSIDYNQKDIQVANIQNSTKDLITLVDDGPFTVKLLQVKSNFTMKREKPFYCCNVISGSGKINNYNVKEGSNIIVLNLAESVEFSGKMTVILSSI